MLIYEVADFLSPEHTEYKNNPLWNKYCTVETVSCRLHFCAIYPVFVKTNLFQCLFESANRNSSDIYDIRQHVCAEK